MITVASASELLNVLREIEALAKLRHPNLVPFCAAVLEVRKTAWCCACSALPLWIRVTAAVGELGGTAL